MCTDDWLSIADHIEAESIWSPVDVEIDPGEKLSSRTFSSQFITTNLNQISEQR